jgi:putative ABC transport system permease protein
MIRFVVADLRRVWLGSLALVLLVGCAVGLGIFVTLEERALRLGSARAADRFDLIVGAMGSDVQLMLSTVFLQPAPLPLLPGAVLQRLARDPRVAWASPVGFGDSFEGRPVVGVAAALVTDGGRTAPVRGRVFEKLDEAVAGSSAGLDLGDEVKPMHGLPGEGGRTHKEIAYRVVGVLPPTGTPWDRAVLVPIEAVWRIHGLGLGHAGHDDADEHDSPAHGAAAPDAPPAGASGPESLGTDRLGTDGLGTDVLGAPWPDPPPGVPAILVKPRGFAEAYRLRNEYRAGATLAVFPAEVLTRLYGTLGDARALLAALAAGTQVLVAAAVLLVAGMQVGQRRQQIAALRAFGASRASVLATVWLEIMVLLGLGIILGVLLGWTAALVVSALVEGRTGVPLPVTFEPSDAATLLALVVAAGVLALAPGWLAFRQPVASALRRP